MARAEEIRLDTPLGRLAGLAWHRPGAPRVLCLHGWLDNAASFLPLAPLLDRLDLVALDLPGHGHSEHRHPTARYHFIDYLWNLDAGLDALQWGSCHVLGHSLGAAISSGYAAGAPERVHSLVLLDTIGPIAREAVGAAARLRRSLIKNRRQSTPLRKYDSLEEMIRARRQRTDLSEPAARLICERAARSVGDHYVWRSDPALNWISSLIMTEEQALDFLQHVEAPVLSMLTTQESRWMSRARLEKRRAAIAQGRHETVEGHHHFHMDAPEQVAGTIQSFIIGHEPPTGTANE